MEALKGILENIKEKSIDKPTATMMAASESDNLYFIGESIWLATALFALHAYLGGLTGLEELGALHRKKLIAFWTKITSGKITDHDIEDSKTSAQTTINELKNSDISEEQKKHAEKEVESLLVENGATKFQANAAAKGITSSLFDDGK